MARSMDYRSAVGTALKVLRVFLLSFLLAGQGFFLGPVGSSYCDCVPIEQVCPCVQAHGACDCESQPDFRPDQMASRSQNQKRPTNPAAWFCVAVLRQKARCLRLQPGAASLALRSVGPLRPIAAQSWADPLWRPPAWLRGPPPAQLVV